jgi:RNA-directed DNA polymerase
MEFVLEEDNLSRAYLKMLANKGSPGMGGIKVDELWPYLKKHKDQLIGLIGD